MEDEGKKVWSEKTGKAYPYKGWWSRPESLDLNIFNIKPFPSVYKQYLKERAIPNTLLIILTSRIEKLRPQLEAILNKNNIYVDGIDMKENNTTKGQQILNYIRMYEDLKEINVYEDRNVELDTYEKIRNQIPKDIIFNVYEAENGKLMLNEKNLKLLKIIQEEIQNFNDEYIYHGTYDGAGYAIQRNGGMKLFNEPFISFTSKPNVANYYANMKGGSERGIVLRTKLTNEFSLSPKYNKNNGYNCT
jgi:hypothetical protein